MTAVFILCITFQAAYAQSPETERPLLMSQLLEDRLGQIALVVDHASDGKSRLLVGSGNSAELTGGGGFVILPSAGWGRMPFATAYRVSEPFIFDVGKGVECRVLGAVVLGVGGTMLGTPQKITPGVYILAFQPESKTTSKGILLIGLRVGDDGHPEYKVLGKGALEPGPTDRGASTPYVEAWFPDTDLYSDGSTYSTLKIDVAWKGENYMFRLVEMDIWMG